MEKKQLKGSIAYLITIEGNNVTTEYAGSPENDIAAVAITELILRDSADYFAAQKQLIKGGDKASIKHKKDTGNLVNLFKKSRSGAARILTILLNAYEGFKEEQVEKDKKSEEIMNYLKENATVEDGVLSNEEAERLLGDKYKDLKKDSSPNENLTKL